MRRAAARHPADRHPSDDAAVSGTVHRLYDRAYVQALSTVARLGLGGVWLVAGILKINNPDGMVRSVRAFRILPEALVEPVAYAVPFMEVALGALLVVGLAVRAGAIVSAVLFAVYIAAIASAAARGLRIDCGCFASGGDLTADQPTRYTSELVRDSLLLGVSALLAVWPRVYLAVDRLLDRSTTTDSGSSRESESSDDFQSEPQAGPEAEPQAGREAEAEAGREAGPAKAEASRDAEADRGGGCARRAHIRQGNDR